MLSDALSDGEVAIRKATTPFFPDNLADEVWIGILAEAIRQMAMVRMCLDSPRFSPEVHVPGSLDKVPQSISELPEYRALATDDLEKYFCLTPIRSAKRKVVRTAEAIKQELFRAITRTEMECRRYVCSPFWADIYGGDRPLYHDKPMRLLAMSRLLIAGLARTDAYRAALKKDMLTYYALTPEMDASWQPQQSAAE